MMRKKVIRRSRKIAEVMWSLKEETKGRCFRSTKKSLIEMMCYEGVMAVINRMFVVPKGAKAIWLTLYLTPGKERHELVVQENEYGYPELAHRRWKWCYYESDDIDSFLEPLVGKKVYLEVTYCT
jgi:hypothetical protein